MRKESGTLYMAMVNTINRSAGLALDTQPTSESQQGMRVTDHMCSYCSRIWKKEGCSLMLIAGK